MSSGRLLRKVPLGVDTVGTSGPQSGGGHTLNVNLGQFCCTVSRQLTPLGRYPESTEAMYAGVDTRVDGQGRANRPGQVPIDGDEGGVK